MIDSIDYESIILFINQEIIQNKLYIQAGGMDKTDKKTSDDFKAKIGNSTWIENTILTIKNGLSKINPLTYITAKNLVSSKSLPDPFSNTEHKTYTTELVLLLLIAGYLLYTDQENEELKFYVYLIISLLVGFYVVINSTSITDATSAITGPANNFVKNITPRAKSEYEIKIEEAYNFILEHFKIITNNLEEVLKTIKQTKKTKGTIQDDEIENIQNEGRKKLFIKKKFIDSNNKMKDFDNKLNQTINYDIYKQTKETITPVLQKLFQQIKTITHLEINIKFINNKTELDFFTKYIDDFKLSEYYNNIYQYLIDPTEEKFKKTITGYFKNKNKNYLEPLMRMLENEITLKICNVNFRRIEYFLSENGDTTPLSILNELLRLIDMMQYLKFEEKKNYEFYSDLDILEKYINISEKLIKNRREEIKKKLDEEIKKEVAKYPNFNINTFTLEQIVEKLKENKKEISDLRKRYDSKTKELGGGFFLFEAPANIGEFLNWIIKYPLDQVKHMFFSSKKSNVSFHFNKLTGLIDITGSVNKDVVLNSSSYFGKNGIVMKISGSNITYEINDMLANSISYIQGKPIHIAFVLSYIASNIKPKSQPVNEYLYSIENDEIRVFKKNPDGSRGNEIQSVNMAIRYEKEGDYQAAKDARNKVCQKLFGVNETNSICATHFYTILGKSGLGMLNNLAEPAKKEHIYTALINAEPNIKYEILKNLGWKIKVLRNDKQIVDVEQWLETLNQELKSEYEKYFQKYPYVRKILNKMIQDLNNNEKILNQKYNESLIIPKQQPRKKRLTSAQIAMLRKI